MRSSSFIYHEYIGRFADPDSSLEKKTKLNPASEYNTDPIQCDMKS